ncbi:MAG: hypothetical protein R2752_23350 [Vicinamibacterales bacterium]
MAVRVRSVTWARSAQAWFDEVARINTDSPANAQRVLVAALDAAASLATPC